MLVSARMCASSSVQPCHNRSGRSRSVRGSARESILGFVAVATNPVADAAVCFRPLMQMHDWGDSPYRKTIEFMAGEQ